MAMRNVGVGSKFMLKRNICKRSTIALRKAQSRLSAIRLRSMNRPSTCVTCSWPDSESFPLEMHTRIDEVTEFDGEMGTLAFNTKTDGAHPRTVRFNVKETVHEVLAYSVVYGMHPREFDFDKNFFIVPAFVRGSRRFLLGFNDAECPGDSCDEEMFAI